MLKLLICEKMNFKSFIKVLNAYGIHQQRPINTKGLKNSRLKKKILVDQQEQNLQLTIIKEEL